MDARSKSVLDTLSGQRNRAMDEIASLYGEISALQESLTDAHKLIAEVNEENVALKDAVEKLAPKQIDTVDHQPV